MSSENADIVTLMDSLEELSEDLVQKCEKIKQLENELETKESEISELKNNLSIFQAQFQQTVEDLRNTKGNFDELQSKHGDFTLDLARKDGELNRTMNQLEIQTNEVKIKAQQVSDERRGRDACERENEVLRRELSSARNKVNVREQQLQAEKVKRKRKNRKWEVKYRRLKQECFAYQEELHLHKYYAEVEKTFQTNQSQETFTERAPYTRMYRGVNTKYYRRRKK